MIRNDYGKDLRPITVRFGPDAWQAIRDLAADNNISQAELIRTTVAWKLHQYLGDVKIIDQQQATEIKAQIANLFTVISEVRNELNRIGVNYNQEVRQRNIERKYGGRDMTDRAGGTALSWQELDALISRYEQATEQVGEFLYRILM